MNNDEISVELLIEKIRDYVKFSVSQKRFDHSVRTAEMCQRLCSIYGLDERIGYLAGISHDMCKKLSPDILLKLAKKDGNSISSLESQKPDLLHGRAAAVMLQEDFDYHNKDVVSAIANHTFGKEGLCDLGKILYVADKIEPGREHITEEYLKKLYKLSLNDLVKTVLIESMDYLKKRGYSVAPESERFLESLN